MYNIILIGIVIMNPPPYNEYTLIRKLKRVTTRRGRQLRDRTGT
jgi:hypothetical protein